MSLILSPLTVATTTRHSKRDKRPSTLPVCCIPTTQPNRASNCDSSNSIFWYLPHYRTSFVGIRPTASKISASLTGKISPMRLPFSSMTPIPHWVLLNCSESWLMRNIWIRRPHGTLFMTLSRIPTILSCPKRLKSGVYICLKGFCPDIWSSSTWLIISGWREWLKSIQEIHIKWMFCRWLKKAIPRKSEWPICVLLVRTRSTVWHTFTLSYSSKTFSRTFMKSFQTSSSTRLTELPPEDGCCVPIPDWQIFTLSTWRPTNGSWTWRNSESWRNSLMIKSSKTNGERSRKRTKQN